MRRRAARAALFRASWYHDEDEEREEPLMSKFVVTGWDGLVCEMLRAAGVDPNVVRRAVFDFEVGKPGKMYLDMYTDDSVLDIPSGTEPGLVAGVSISAQP